MFKVPLSFYFDFESVADAERSGIMQEFSRCGAKHLVLTDALVKKIIADPSFADTLKKEMSDNNLTFCDGHAPYGIYDDMHCPFSAMRRMMLARQKLVLEICSYMNVNTVTMHLGSTRVPPTNTIKVAAHLDNVRETLAEQLPTAEKLGVTICIENSWYPLCTPENLLMLKQEFPSSHLGFCYDAGHANIMDNGRLHPSGSAFNGWKTAGFDCTPPWENMALEKMLPHIVNCHLHDNMGESDAHTLPGRGNVKWQHIISTLQKAPHLQVIQSEVSLLKNNISIAELTAKFEELSHLADHKKG